VVAPKEVPAQRRMVTVSDQWISCEAALLDIFVAEESKKTQLDAEKAQGDGQSGEALQGEWQR
jgi:hypothetical protein